MQTFEPDAGRLVNAVIPARWYTRTTGRQVDVLVYHDMESPEGAETAESVSRWAQTIPDDPRRKASWHYAADTNSIVQCVLERDVAYAAPGANHNGVHIECAGVARQTRAEWFDAYSRPMLELVAKLSVDIIRRNDLPVVWLSVADLRAGKRGITSHNNVSLAFGKSTHTDPGPGFPHDWMLARIRDLMEPAPTPVARWSAYAAGKRIGRGSLLNPAFVMRITSALRAAGHSAPWRATVDGVFLAEGRLWLPGAFTKAISGQLRAGRQVVLNDTVTLLKETP